MAVRNLSRAALVSLLFMVVVISVVDAHMSVTPSEISPGGRATFGLSISHDCGDDTLGTTNFTVGVPEGLVSIKVEDTQGWHIIMHKAHMDPPVTVGTHEYNETIHSVEFHGFLADDMYKTFGIKAQAIETLKVGSEIYWSGYQECHGDGTPIAWATIPSEEDPDPKRPAVATKIVEEKESHH